MVYCKGCGCDIWDLVVGDIAVSMHGQFNSLDLFQCRSCKRVIASTIDEINEKEDEM